MRLQKYVQTLMEASKYDPMFEKIKNLQFVKDKELLSQNIEDNINWARTNLKKEDRIMWFLRIVKYTILEKLNNEMTNIRADDFADERFYVQTDMKKLVSKLPFLSGGVGYTITALKNVLEHYLGQTRITKIQTHVFSKESPADLFDLFSSYERKWHEENGGKIVAIQDGDELVLSFDNGNKGWWLLNRGACRDEGDAMGHCGNAPSVSSRDRILSFRVKIDEDNWTPHLTFILDEYGMLGEMKGRGNEKPAKKYHPYIVELLKRTDLVEGIKGGGYLPANNFSLNDLDHKVKEELEQLNPNLISIFEKYRTSGLTKEIEAGLLEKLKESSLPLIHDINNKEVTLEQWDSLEQFTRYNNFPDLDSFNDLIEIYKSETIDQEKIEIMSDDVTISEQVYSDIIKELPEQILNKILKALDITVDFENTGSILKLIDHIDKSYYGKIFRKSILYNVTVKKHSLLTIENMERYLDLSWYIIYYASPELHNECYYDYNKKYPFNGPVEMKIPTRTFVDVLETSFDPEAMEYGEEEAFYAARASQDGWFYVDYYELEHISYDEIFNDKDDIVFFKKLKKLVKKEVNGYYVGIIKDGDVNPSDVAREVVKMIHYNESRDIEHMLKLAGVKRVVL